MPDLTDVERGLALAGQKASRALPLLAIAQAVNTASLRQAAANLGKVFAELKKTGYRTGDWLAAADWTPTGLRIQPWQLDGPTVKVYGNVDANTRFQRYYSDCEKVIPAVERAAITWALATLGGQAKVLGALGNEIGAPGFSNWMHEASKQISTRLELCVDAAMNQFRATGRYPAAPKEFSDVAGDRASGRCLETATDSFLQSEKTAKVADDREAAQKKYDYVSTWPQRSQYGELFQILRNQKRYLEIVEAYARSPAEGANLTRTLITNATEGITKFSASLTSLLGNVWRYPVLVIGGVRELKLQDLEGFQDFALEVSRIKGADPVQKFLNTVGVGLLLIGLITGPAAGLIGLDLAVGGIGGIFAFLRDREKMLAVNATSFLPDEEKFARDFGYGDTALAVAFTLLAILSVVRGRRGSSTPAGAVTGGAATGETAGSARPRTLPSSEPLPPRGTPEKPAAMPETTATGTPAATATGTPAATATGTPSATATGTTAATVIEPLKPPATGSSAIDPRVAERIRPKIRKGGQQAPAPPAAKPEVKPTEPVNRGLPDEAETVLPSKASKEKSPARAPSRAQKGVPPKTTPPNLSTATSAAPGRSSVADTSFTLTQQQRGFPSKALTYETEQAVGAKLESATGLKAKSYRTNDAKRLREQISGDSKAAPITEPTLLKEPVITDPRYPAPKDNLASAKPDYLLLGTEQHEVFEVTVDSRFSIVPQERGLQFRGSTGPLGNPHKQIQVRKTLDYLIRRYPDHTIVYNIQTIGEVPTEVLNILQTEVDVARKLMAAQRGKGSVEIIVRAEQNTTFR